MGSAVWGGAAETAAPVAGDALSQGKAAWEKRTDMAETRHAIELFQQAAATPANAYEAKWRLCRGYWWLGNHVPAKERPAVFEKGKLAGEEAVRLNPNAVEGHYWLGVCMGRYGEEHGILNSLFLVDPIAREMEAVLKLNPKHGEAQFVLGVLYRKAPGWPVSRGDMKKSLAFAEQAVANNPELVLHHVGLARTLLALNRTEEAKKELQTALAIPGPADRLPETADDKAEAQDVLKQLR